MFCHCYVRGDNFHHEKSSILLLLARARPDLEYALPTLSIISSPFFPLIHLPEAK